MSIETSIIYTTSDDKQFNCFCRGFSRLLALA